MSAIFEELQTAVAQKIKAEVAQEPVEQNTKEAETKLNKLLNSFSVSELQCLKRECHNDHQNNSSYLDCDMIGIEVNRVVNKINIDKVCLKLLDDKLSSMEISR